MTQPDGPPTHARLETTSGGKVRVTFWIKRQLASHVLPDDANVAGAIAVYKRRGMTVEDYRLPDGQ